MSLITISDLTMEYGPDTILQYVSLSVARGERIGIVGRNGGGKTTLLKAVLGIEQPAGGNIHIAKGIRIGYLSQIQSIDESQTVIQAAEVALTAVADAENELRKAEAALAENPTDEELTEALGAAQDRHQYLGGHYAVDGLHASLKALGFPESTWDKQVSVLSGGEKTRLAMARLLATSPEVLILDEPTNHLDIKAIEWLENFLVQVPGAVLVVSHDRRFLDRVTKATWEVDAHRVNVYGCAYSEYRRRRDAERQQQLDEYLKQQAHIQKTEEYIRRNKAGQNTRNAMGRQKVLNRLDRIDRPMDDGAMMRASVGDAGRSGLDVVVAQNLNKSFGERIIVRNANFTLRRGDRVGVVGPNGAGKTTLINMLLGEDEIDSGHIRTGHGVKIAHHKQEQDDFGDEESLLDAFYDRAGLTIAECRMHLAKFLFTGEDVFKPVSGLSGGERAKLAMSLMVLSPANLLILDEPTNHLDVFSCDALAQTLARFAGTLLVVSHDRSLLDETTNKTLYFDGTGNVTLYDMPYSAWRDAMAAMESQPTRKKTIDQPSVPSAPSALQRSRDKRKLQTKLEAIEAKITEVEAEIAALEARLSSPLTPDEAIADAKSYEASGNQLEQLMSDWELLGSQIDELS
ncbi:MAG: ABC-F family ATP-binding cassette domain-containing protein [Armatimonadota bacterium]